MKRVLYRIAIKDREDTSMIERSHQGPRRLEYEYGME